MGVKTVNCRSDGGYSHLIALDAEPGKGLWRSEPAFQIAHASSSLPMKVTNGREDIHVIVTGGGTVVRADDGRTLCSIPAVLARGPGEFSRYLSSPVTIVGPFPLAKSDAVLAKLGGPESACVGLCRNPEKPAAPGFHFRLDDSSDVAAERKERQERLRLAKPVVERIVKHATASGYVEKAKKLLAAMDAGK